MGEVIRFTRDPRGVPRVLTKKTCTACREPIASGVLYVGGPDQPRHVACPTRTGVRGTFHALRTNGARPT